MNWKQMVDSAFHAGSKESGKTQRAKEALTIRKKKEQARVKTIGKKLISELKELSQKIPSLESLDAFSREMISSIRKPEELFRASSQLLKLAKIINKVQRETSIRIFSAKNENNIILARNQFLARVNSVMKSSEKSLRIIDFFEKNSRRIPVIDSTNPIAVLAGYPNTGKTTILSRITSSKPKIASYAFTTQDLNIGKMQYKFFEMQVIDTPGILDRPKEKRNEIERKAAAALKYLAKIIFFVMDASLSCGFSIEEQMKLLEQTRKEFPETALIVLLNKIDLANEENKEEFRNLLEKEKIEFIECGAGTEEELKEELKKYLDSLKLEFR